MHWIFVFFIFLIQKKLENTQLFNPIKIDTGHDEVKHDQ